MSIEGDFKNVLMNGVKNYEDFYAHIVLFDPKDLKQKTEYADYIK